MARLVIRHRRAVIVATVATTLILGFFIKDLKINSDILSYLPKSDRAVELFDHIGKGYGGNNLAIVALESDDVFTPETVARINDLTQKLKLLDGVSYVTSLANVMDIRSEEGFLEIRRLIDEYDLPDTPEEIHALKEYALKKDMYSGRLVSEDAKVTLIISRIRDGADKLEVARQVKKIVAESDLQERAYFSGLPFQMISVNEIIQGDLRLLVPLVVLLICVSLFVSFRTLHGVLLPLLSVSISSVWTLGIMSVLNVPFTVVSNIIPVILIAVGSAYGIHVISKFDEEAAGEEDRIRQSERALREITVPVFLAGITTIVGFISFIFGSYLNAIEEFGFFTALGVLFSLVISLSFIPSVLSLVPVKKRTPSGGRADGADGLPRIMEGISRWVLKNAKLIIIGSGVLVVALSVFAVPNIKRKVDILDYFRKGNSLRVAEEMMQAEFGGSFPVQILVKGDIQDPVVLRQMKGLQEFLKTQDRIHKPQSMVDLIEEMSDAMGEGRRIPDSKDKVANLWFLLEGEDMVSQLVNQDKTEAVIQATVPTMDTEYIKTLARNIDAYIGTISIPNVTFEQTGIPIIYQHLDDSLIRSQLWSLAIAVLLVFVCILLMLRSFVGGAIGLIPILFTLLLVFGFMGITGIPLDIATVLVGSVSIGIGIDYSIHFVNRFKEELKASRTIPEALDRTLETTGRAILTNVVTVLLGFLVLALANLVPLQRFGILVALTMIGSGFGAITLLPAAILVTRAKFIGGFDGSINGVKSRPTSEEGERK